MFSAYCDLSCFIDLKSIISRIDDFKDIKQSTLDEIINISHIKDYSKDTIIYYKNDIVPNIFYLFHGVVKEYIINKYGNEVIINLYINDCANHNNPPLINYEAFHKNTSNHSLCCLQECRTLQIDAIRFKKLIDKDVTLQRNLLQAANRVINRQEDVIKLAMVYDSRAKVVSFLMQHPNIFSVVNKKTIAQRLNISQETFSRIIKKLQKDKLIDIVDKKIIIKNYKKLSAMLK